MLQYTVVMKKNKRTKVTDLVHVSQNLKLTILLKLQLSCHQDYWEYGINLSFLFSEHYVLLSTESQVRVVWVTWSSHKSTTLPAPLPILIQLLLTLQ